MKKLITSSVTSTSRQPLLGRSITHITEGYVEAFNSVMKQIIRDYTTNDVVIIEGLIDTGTAGVNYNISAGSVYYNGEIYQVAADSGTFAGTVAVLTETTTYQSGDPVTNTDGSLVNVHQIKTMVISNATTGSGTKDYLSCKKIKAHPLFATISTMNWVAAGAAGVVMLPYNASPFDEGNYLNISNGEISLPLGRYKISFCSSCTPSSSPAAGTSIQAAIYKDSGSGYVVFDYVIGDHLNGNFPTSIQFNNYIIEQTNITHKWKMVILTGINIDAQFTSTQLTIEAVSNSTLKPY